MIDNLPRIHASSVIDPGATIADDVEIGPFCYVEAGVTLGTGCKLDSHVTIKSGTTCGARNVFGQGAIIGGDPQDRKWKGQPTFLNIGDDNTFREYVTVHRANNEGGATVIGDRNFLMAYCHLGHNTHVMNDVTMANSVGVSGHCTVEDSVMIGGMVGVHQYVRIGRLAMVGGLSKLVRDVPPFMLVEGILEQKVHDINAIGLRRIGITQSQRLGLHKACKLLFKSQFGLTKAMEIVRREVPSTPELEELLAFMERIAKGKNGRGDQR